jgi:hypothetical protein
MTARRRGPAQRPSGRPWAGMSTAARAPTTACAPWRRARSAVALTPRRPSVGPPGPSPPRRVSAASCRTCGPKAATRAGTMGGRGPALVPPCPNASARAQGPHPPLFSRAKQWHGEPANKEQKSVTIYAGLHTIRSHRTW